jgi:hypothetical protein
MEHDAARTRNAETESGWRTPPPRPHPKPEAKAPASLNQAVRQELWYLDTMMAMPFRTVRRMLRIGGEGRRVSPLVEGLDELVWAAEGMSRLPIKILQSAFGEDLAHGEAARPARAVAGKGSPEPPAEGRARDGER